MLPKITDPIAFEDYVVDRADGSLRWRGEPIPMSRKTFDVLAYLIEHRDRVVPKEELFRELWPEQVVEDSNLTQQMFLLRKTLFRYSANKIIETVAGRGYRFVASVQTPVASPPPEAVEPPGATDTLVVQVEEKVTRVAIEDTTLDKPVARSRVWIATLAVILLSVGGFVAWRYRESRSVVKSVEVVLADFGDGFEVSSIGPPLNDAIRIDLAQSPFVTVLAPSKVRKTLALMQQKPGVTLDATLAREVCERTGAQAFLQGQVTKFGEKYLAVLRATNCVTRELVAENKEEVDRPDDLPHAIDLLTAKIRADLGESRDSIRRFDTPLITVSTGSLEALKAYSEAKHRFISGDYTAALPFFERAVTIDPSFGSAYLDMAAAFYNMGDKPHMREALTKAYALRETVSESSRYLLIGFYHHEVTGDIYKSLETYKAWAALYPNSKAAVGSLAVEYENIGRAAEAVPLGKRALELDPTNYAVYQNLASFELHSGDLGEAEETCKMTIAMNMDKPGIRDLLLDVLYEQHDVAGVQTQLEWGRSHNHPLQLMIDEIMIAITQGEIRRARALLVTLDQTYQPAEMEADLHIDIAQLSRMLADYGLGEDSLKLLSRGGSFEQNEDALIALAESGRVAQAEAGLRADSANHEHDMFWTESKAPEVQAAILLSEHRAADAIHALEPTVPFDGVSLGPIYIRARAYLESGDTDRAAVEFKMIVQHQYIDSLSNLYPLALLEMARLSAQKKDVGQAGKFYREVLDIWKAADADFPQLLAARREFAAII